MSGSIYILGISAFYHDSAACLLKDGAVIAAAQEERFSRIRHDESFPSQAIQYCLEKAGIGADALDHVVFYEKPFLKFERILETYLAAAPAGFQPFRLAMKAWLGKKLWIPSIIKKETGFKGKLLFAEHHEAHAASACFTSPFGEAAFLTMDGVGEWATATYGIFRNGKIHFLAEQVYPHSVGLLYSAFTAYCGFKVNSAEYKLMGLAPYGKPVFADLIREKLVHIADDGSIRLEMKHFGFSRSLKMISKSFEKLFGRPARRPETKIDPFYMDVAASIQQVLEEILLKTAAHVRSVTGMKNLCFSGGVALNCSANGKLLRSGIFDAIHIHPAAGDAGGALGAAKAIWHQHLGNEFIPQKRLPATLGPVWVGESVRQILESHSGLVFHQPEADDLLPQIVQALQNDEVIGWFSGPMEWGPRALGHRSILANPVDAEMQQKLNMAIKKRESFRPFAPAVPEDDAIEWFDLDRPSPDMLFTAKCLQPEKIPACVHVDGTSRVQTVRADENPRFYSLLKVFQQASGIPVLINTSFNVRGEPIVCTPEDAIRCFFHTDMDVLVLENCLIRKKDQHSIPQKFQNTVVYAAD